MPWHARTDRVPHPSHDDRHPGGGARLGHQGLGVFRNAVIGHRTTWFGLADRYVFGRHIAVLGCRAGEDDQRRPLLACDRLQEVRGQHEVSLVKRGRVFGAAQPRHVKNHRGRGAVQGSGQTPGAGRECTT